MRTLLLGLVLLFAPIAAAQDFSEQFDYVPGTSLSGQGGWFTAAGNGTITVIPGSLSYPGYSRDVGNSIELTAPTAGDERSASHALPTSITTGEFYMSFLVHFTELPTTVTRIAAASNAGTGNLPMRIRAGTQGGEVALSIKKSDGPDAPAMEKLALNQTYLIVARYTFNGGVDDDEVALWIDPSPLPGNETPPTPNVASTIGTDRAAITNVRVRQNVGVGRLELDDLRAATSYAELDATLAVELASFTASIDGDVARLAWTTASETGNAGFHVQMAAAAPPSWTELGYVPGAGTSASERHYTYDAALPGPGLYRFRLVHTDLDGRERFGPEVSARAEVAGAYVLMPAYPNPFNPTTTIRFAVRETQDVRVDVFDALGRRVQTLFSGVAEGGETYRLAFDAGDLPSGAYLYRIQGEGFSDTRQLMLVR